MRATVPVTVRPSAAICYLHLPDVEREQIGFTTKARPEFAVDRQILVDRRETSD